MTDNDKEIVLANIATDIIVAELKRRAEAGGMTTDELIQAAADNWERAEIDAEKLQNLGHE